MVAAIVFGFISMIPSAAEEKLELLDIREEISENGTVNFVGSVKNNSREGLFIQPRIVITLKKEGKVVGFFEGYARVDEKLSITPTAPGQTAIFSIETDKTPDEYDDFKVDLQHVFPTIDESLVTGSLAVDSTSVNFLPDRNGNLIILGEITNETNAFISEIVIQFSIYDPQNRLVGKTFVTELNGKVPLWSEFYPGEVMTMEAHGRNIPFTQADQWEISALQFKAVRLVAENIPTVRNDLTWGRIKETITERNW